MATTIKSSGTVQQSQQTLRRANRGTLIRNVGLWFAVGVVVFMLGRELYLRLRSLNAGRMLFSELLTAVLYAPMSFYDTTPLGRIINRYVSVFCWY